MSFLGLFNFNAPYLPWVLLFFSMLLGASPVMDLLGVAAGHIYYFLEFVYPRMRGIRLLQTPRMITFLFETETAVEPMINPQDVPLLGGDAAEAAPWGGDPPGDAGGDGQMGIEAHAQ